MTNSICFHRGTFLIMVTIMIIATTIFFYYNPQKNNSLFMSETKCPPCEIKKEAKEPTATNETKIVINEDNPVVNPFVEYDRRALSDPLAPYRRLPAYLYPRYPLSTKLIFLLSYPELFQFMGNLVRQRDQRFVQLFGRQTYPGSNQYEYYGVAKDDMGLKVKLQIDVKNDKELYDGDKVKIPTLGTGEFILHLNDLKTHNIILM